MTIEAQALIARIRAQRESWLEVEPGKELRIRRPAETRMLTLRNGVSLESAVECVVDWRGLTEADLLGAAIGSSDPLPFDSALCLEVVADRVAWLEKISTRLVEQVVAFIAKKDDAVKN